MTETISRWGNGLGVRLPKAALEDARLQEGDRLEVVCRNGRLTMIKLNRRPTLEELLVGTTAENGHDETFSTLVGNEVR